jgi:hypothetical protein
METKRYARYMLWKVTRNGWHAEGLDENGNRMTLTTYSNGYEPEPKDLVQSQGATVLDCRTVSDDAVIDAVIKGPMFDALLESGQVREACCDVRPYVEGEPLTSLMYAALDVYTNFWRSFPETRVGIVKGRFVAWEGRGCKPLL